jgi:hypothetical protein
MLYCILFFGLNKIEIILRLIFDLKRWQDIINREYQRYGDERQHQLDLTKIQEFLDILKRVR